MRLHRGSPVAERDGLVVINCQPCGFTHLDPLPNAEQLRAFYANEFWQHKKVGTRERMDAQREWWSAIYGDWLALVARHVAIGTALLDVGAGYGHFMEAAELAGFEMKGIDPSADVNHPAIIL